MARIYVLGSLVLPRMKSCTSSRECLFSKYNPQL